MEMRVHTGILQTDKQSYKSTCLKGIKKKKKRSSCEKTSKLEKNKYCNFTPRIHKRQDKYINLLLKYTFKYF